MLLIAMRQQHIGAQIDVRSPEIAEDVAADLYMLDPLAVFRLLGGRYGLRQGQFKRVLAMDKSNEKAKAALRYL